MLCLPPCVVCTYLPYQMSMKEAITAYSIGFLGWFGCGCVIRVCNAVKNQSDEFGDPEVGPTGCVQLVCVSRGQINRDNATRTHFMYHVNIIDWPETGTGEWHLNYLRFGLRIWPTNKLYRLVCTPASPNRNLVLRNIIEKREFPSNNVVTNSKKTPLRLKHCDRYKTRGD